MSKCPFCDSELAMDGFCYTCGERIPPDALARAAQTTQQGGPGPTADGYFSPEAEADLNRLAQPSPWGQGGYAGQAPNGYVQNGYASNGYNGYGGSGMPMPTLMDGGKDVNEACYRFLMNDGGKYLERFESQSVFNGWAFFFGATWYAYRGMLLYAAIYAFVPCASLILGFSGDYWYRRHVQKHAEYMVSNFTAGSREEKEYIEKKGAPSIVRAIAFALVVSVIYAAIKVISQK